MPDILVGHEYRRPTEEAIFQWYKRVHGQSGIYVMPPQQETANGVLFLAVPDAALPQLDASGIPFERR